MPESTKPATLSEVMQFFGYERAADFTREWKLLTPQDQQHLKQGIGDGSFTY